MTKNVNQNVNTIIFPSDMELRKVRKAKPKKKGPSKKQLAIDDLKGVLAQFDAVVAEAKQKNITIPKELGVLPQNIKEIDSLSEITALTADLRQRIQTIQALIQKAATPSLFGDISQPLRPGVFPQPIPVAPTPIQPAPVTPDDATGRTLDQIREEILGRLTPAQRAEAEERIAEQAPGDIPGRAVAEPESDYESQVNVEFGSRTIPKIVSPIGFMPIFEDYRRYLKVVAGAPVLITKGQYRLPQDKVESIDIERKRIVTNLSAWNAGLNEGQTKYVRVDPTMKSVLSQMRGSLNSAVGDFTERLLMQSVDDVVEFKVGDDPVDIEKKVVLSERGEQYKTELKGNVTKILGD